MSAQVWRASSPTAIALTPLLRPATSTGVTLLVVEPFPSSPFPFLPQHLAPPALVTAQLWRPAAIAPTPLVRPVTSTGVLLSVVELFPRTPSELWPQHLTPPALVSAQ